MRQFDYREAKAGKPVYTREGSKVRIICLDSNSPEYPIIALVKDENGIESPQEYTEDGYYYAEESLHGHEMDLCMKDIIIAKFVNVYNEYPNYELGTGHLYDTEEEAKLHILDQSRYKGTFPIFIKE